MTWMIHPSEHVAAPLKTIANAHPQLHSEIEHIVQLPMLCYRSANPARGSTLRIRYVAQARILELFALQAYVEAFVGHTVVRDMEYFVQVVALECAQALGVAVELQGDIQYNGLQMGQRILVRA